MYSIPPEKKQQIKQIAQSGKMIEAIKEYRLLTNASLKDAKGAVEALMRGDYVDGPAPASQSAGSSQERQILDLMSQGREIDAIKLYRSWTSAGLKEAKNAVEAMARGETVHIPVPAPSLADDSMDGQIRALLAKKQKIEAIKIYRLATNLGLKEAKDYVESIEAQMLPQPPAKSSPMNIPISNDPFEEENTRTRRLIMLALFLILMAAIFLFLRYGF